MLKRFGALLLLLAALGGANRAQAQIVWHDFRWTTGLSGPVEVRAEQMTAFDDGARLLLEGSVHVVGEKLDVRAKTLEVWPKSERAVFQGDVRVIDNQNVILADRLELERKTSRAFMERAVFLYKTEVDHKGLSSCGSAAELAGRGVTSLRLSGERWVRQDGTYLVHSARFTPCDCGPDEAPTWELSAVEADVVPDDRAIVSWPVMFAKGLPVFILPSLYLPMSSRRTGLLMPQVNYSGRDGFVLSDSLFVTLGEQADTTATLDWIEQRGFRPRLELRAIPVRNSWIEARVSYIADAKAEAAMPNRVGRDRAAGELQASWGKAGFGAKAEVRLYTDSDIPRDFLTDIAGRAAESAPSGLSLTWRGDNAMVELGAGWVQDLRRSAVDLFALATDKEIQALPLDPVGDAIQRLGTLKAWLTRVALLGGSLRFGLRAEAQNLMSLRKAWLDFGPDGTPDPLETRYANAPASGDFAGDNIAGGENDGRLGDGELRRAVRLLVEPSIAAPLKFGHNAAITAELKHRQLLFLPHGEGAPDASTRGTSYAELTLETELSRTFGEGADALRHVLRPSLAVAGAFRGLSTGGPFQTFDLEDRLHRDALQLVAGLEQLLLRRGAGLGATVLELAIGQGVDLGNLEVAELGLTLGLGSAFGRLDLVLGWNWGALALSEADAAFSLHDRRGDALRFCYLYLPSSSDALGRPLPFAERTQREIGLLFGGAPSPLRGVGDGLHVVGADATVQLLWGFQAQGSVNVNLRDVSLSWFGAGLSYQSRCHCFGLSASFRMLPDQSFPDLFFLLDLGLLGRSQVRTATVF